VNNLTNTIFLIIIVAILLFTIVRRKLIMTNPNVKNLTAEEANKLIHENKDVFILDVRTKGEYANGHIPGAKLIPSSEIVARVSELEKYVNKPILVYCASGGRSPGAVQALVKNNFTEIYHLNRGISSWTYDIKR
jgi:rhodanese-related sulfurtransferase